MGLQVEDGLGCGVAVATTIGLWAIGPFQEADGWLSVIRLFLFAGIAIGTIIVSTKTYYKPPPPPDCEYFCRSQNSSLAGCIYPRTIFCLIFI